MSHAIDEHTAYILQVRASFISFTVPLVFSNRSDGFRACMEAWCLLIILLCSGAHHDISLVLLLLLP